MKILTTPGASRTPTRWRAAVFRPLDEDGIGIITCQLLTTGLMEVSLKEVIVRDGGMSDRVSIDTSPSRIRDTLFVEEKAVSTPTGFTDAINAWRLGGATPAARRDALETWMLSAGVAGANMAGT